MAPRWVKLVAWLSALALAVTLDVRIGGPVFPSSEDGDLLRALNSTLYQTYRTAYRGFSLSRLSGFEQVGDARLAVYFRPWQREDARLVLAAANEVYDGAARVVGPAGAPPVPLVMHPDRQSMDATFGWRGGETASGAYWAGIVHILSPSAWLPWVSAEQRNLTYRRLSPLAHETTHYMLDYRTGGNYPRWFTEGLAQWVEYHLTGYFWRAFTGGVDRATYDYDDLASRFDRLDNQALAYRQALALVEFFTRRCGENGLEQIIAGLAAGRSFTASVFKACGAPPALMMDLWQKAGSPPYPPESTRPQVSPRAGELPATAERWR